MEEPLAQLERALRDLARQIRELEQRVSALEERAEGSQAAPVQAAPDEAALAARTGGMDGVALLTLVGRACLVLGGAYLLRAFTDSGMLPRQIGTTLGLLYGIAWMLAAWRRPERPSAEFHVAVSTLIVFPILWEAAVRYHVLSWSSAAVAMGVASGLGLGLAWHRRRQALAWIVTIAGMLAAIVFMASGTTVPMVIYLAFLGVCTLWLGYTVDWTWLRWPVAAVVDLTVVFMVAAATEVWHRDEAGAVMLAQLVLFAGYLTSFAARTLYRSRDVVPFEIVQTAALLVVGFGGAVYLKVVTGSSAADLGIGSLVFGVGSYAVAFAFIDWRGGHWRNFVFYASLGAVFIIAGTATTVARPVQAVTWAMLAVASAVAARHYAASTLSSHAAVYVSAAAIVSGLLGHAADGLVAPPGTAWAPLTASGTVALAAALCSAAVPLARTNDSWGRGSRVGKIVLVIVLVWSAGGSLCAALVPWLAGPPGSPTCDGAITASIRTVVLCASALLLGWASRGPFAEGRHLMYVVLAVAAVKLLIEDLPNGRPSTLFLSFAVYGTALILGPRLAVRPRTPGPSPPSAVPPADNAGP